MSIFASSCNASQLPPFVVGSNFIIRPLILIILGIYMARLSAADFKYIYLYDFYVSTTK